MLIAPEGPRKQQRNFNGWLIGCGVSAMSVSEQGAELPPCSKGPPPAPKCEELRRLSRRPPGNRTQVAGTEAQMQASAPTAPYNFNKRKPTSV